jgi:hypothetical protein
MWSRSSDSTTSSFVYRVFRAVFVMSFSAVDAMALPFPAAHALSHSIASTLAPSAIVSIVFALNSVHNPSSTAADVPPPSPMYVLISVDGGTRSALRSISSTIATADSCPFVTRGRGGELCHSGLEAGQQTDRLAVDHRRLVGGVDAHARPHLFRAGRGPASCRTLARRRR